MRRTFTRIWLNQFLKPVQPFWVARESSVTSRSQGGQTVWDGVCSLRDEVRGCRLRRQWPPRAALEPCRTVVTEAISAHFRAVMCHFPRPLYRVIEKAEERKIDKARQSLWLSWIWSKIIWLTPGRAKKKKLLVKYCRLDFIYIHMCVCVCIYIFIFIGQIKWLY